MATRGAAGVDLTVGTPRSRRKTAGKGRSGPSAGKGKIAKAKERAKAAAAGANAAIDDDRGDDADARASSRSKFVDIGEAPVPGDTIAMSAPGSGEDAPLFKHGKLKISIYATKGGKVVMESEKNRRKDSWTPENADDMAVMLKMAAKFARRA